MEDFSEAWTVDYVRVWWSHLTISQASVVRMWHQTRWHFFFFFMFCILSSHATWLHVLSLHSLQPSLFFLQVFCLPVPTSASLYPDIYFPSSGHVHLSQASSAKHAPTLWYPQSWSRPSWSIPKRLWDRPSSLLLPTLPPVSSSVPLQRRCSCQLSFDGRWASFLLPSLHPAWTHIVKLSVALDCWP